MRNLFLEFLAGDTVRDVNLYMGEFIKLITSSYELSTVTKVERKPPAKLECPWMNDHLLAIVEDNIDIYEKTKRRNNRNNYGLKVKLIESNTNVARWNEFYSRKYYVRMLEGNSDPKQTWRKIN